MYLGNSKLKSTEEIIEFTEEQLEEIVKCMQNITYFCENYVKIVTADGKLINFKPYDFQRNIIKTVDNERFTLIMQPRQTGKTTVITCYILHYILFNKNKSVAIMAHKETIAKQILARIKNAYENLPLWLQQGIKVWNKKDIELENGSRVLSAATSASGIRGESISLLYLDELGFVPKNIAEEFYASVYPTVMAGNETKLIGTSTPQGFNFWYKLYSEAEQGLNSYKAIRVHWHEIPGRDNKWLEEQRKNLGELKFNQEILCEFIGSSNTLIRSTTLRNLALRPIIKQDDHLKIIENPEENHIYFISVDVSEGKEQDYSIITIIDITDYPYKQVALYRNNTISPSLLPFYVEKLATQYNNAYVLVENNSIGAQVVETLNYTLEYENLISLNHLELGLRTTKKTKFIGCFRLKDLVEQEKLLLSESETFIEMSNFVNKNSTYKADVGYSDDIMMSLVNFAYITSLSIFEDITNMSYMDKIRVEQEKLIEESLVPFGFYADPFEKTISFEDQLFMNILNK